MVMANKKENVIRPTDKKPRQNWAKQFEDAISAGDKPEGELLEGFENEFDETEWTW